MEIPFNSSWAVPFPVWGLAGGQANGSAVLVPEVMARGGVETTRRAK